MRLLTSLKQTLNISGVEALVVIEDRVHDQSDRVIGRVVIRGGGYEQSGRTIKVELKEFWTEARYVGDTTTTVTVFKTHEEAILANNFSIRPHSKQRYQFEVQLPMNCRQSAKDAGWILVVTMEIPGAAHPIETATQKAESVEEVQTIIKACDLDVRLQKDILCSLLERGVTIFLTSHVLEIVGRPRIPRAALCAMTTRTNPLLPRGSFLIKSQ